MRIVYTLALILALVVFVAGGAAVTWNLPAWVGTAYGLVGAVAVWCVLDVLAMIWTAKPVG